MSGHESFSLCNGALKDKTRVKHRWYRFKNGFRLQEEPGEPLRFLRGSQEELERITCCICHVDEEAFADVWERYSLEVRYHAATAKHNGGFGQNEPDHACAWHVGGNAFWFGLRSERLIHLAFAYNTFRAARWPRVWVRRSDWQLASEKLIVRIAPPSAHERAEALLYLYDWLEGKVTAKERAALLNIA